MVTDVADTKVLNLFTNLESQKSILATCTDLYKTLISHLTSIEQSISYKSETLTSKLEFLNSNMDKTLEGFQLRKDSIPSRFTNLTDDVESRKQIAMEEFQKETPIEELPIRDALKSVCRKMDHGGLLRLAVTRKKESVAMRAEMANALMESVDPPRLLLDTVQEFLDMKAAGKGGMTDKRRACATIVLGMFPPDELVEKKGGRGSSGPEFSSVMVKKAEEILKEWIVISDKVASSAAGAFAAASGRVGDEEGSTGMGPAEASMFLQIVLGFGLKDKFEEEFYRKLVVEFSARRDMPKLAIPILGDKMADIIDELVEKGKYVEAVYFATDTGLTERFNTLSLLKSSLQTYKSNVAAILKKGNRTQTAIDEANNYEMNSIRFIIKCVEDYKMESEFPLETLRKRLSVLEKARADKKKGSSSVSKSSNKRGHSSGPGRSNGPPPPFRPPKLTRYSNTYPSIPPTLQSPGLRYPTPYNYPGYNPGPTSSPYGPNYGGSQHAPPPSAQLAQQQYGSQQGYVPYDYNAAVPPAYKPSPYT